LEALIRLGWARLLGGKSPEQAAREVRSWLHRESNRQRRLKHALAAIEFLKVRFPEHRLSMAGHSFGTDTALLVALREPVENLYLFSPHPPGYLVANQDYRRLKAQSVWVVTGEKDFTRDGVGPQQRVRVVDFLDPKVSRAPIVLPGVGHMDFAFEGLGPQGWSEGLQGLTG